MRGTSHYTYTGRFPSNLLSLWSPSTFCCSFKLPVIVCACCRLQSIQWGFMQGHSRTGMYSLRPLSGSQSWTCTSFGLLPVPCLCTTSAQLQAILSYCTKRMDPVFPCQQVKYYSQMPAQTLLIPIRNLYITEFRSHRQSGAKLKDRHIPFWREEIFLGSPLFYHVILTIGT